MAERQGEGDKGKERVGEQRPRKAGLDVENEFTARKAEMLRLCEHWVTLPKQEVNEVISLSAQMGDSLGNVPCKCHDAMK